jgi:hypothetical protein
MNRNSLIQELRAIVSESYLLFEKEVNIIASRMALC